MMIFIFLMKVLVKSLCYMYDVNLIFLKNKILGSIFLDFSILLFELYNNYFV